MEVAGHWRKQPERYNLIAEICPCCDTVILPKRDICPKCASEAKEECILSGFGVIYSFTATNKLPEGFQEQTPIKHGIIRLLEGPLITAQLTDLDPNIPLEDQLVLDKTPLKMVTRYARSDGKRGLRIYVPKFRPLLAFEEKQFEKIKQEIESAESIRAFLQPQLEPLPVDG